MRSKVSNNPPYLGRYESGIRGHGVVSSP